MEDNIRRAGIMWSRLCKGYSAYSRQVLPPWDLLAEHVMRSSSAPTSHAALCAAAFFGQGMTVMPTPHDLSVTWQTGIGSFNLHCIPAAHDEAKRYLIPMLVRRCDSTVIMRMRLEVNETFSQTKRRPIPRFEVLHELLLREREAAVRDGAVCIAEIEAVAAALESIGQLRLCPVTP